MMWRGMLIGIASASLCASAILAQESGDGETGVARGKQVYDYWCAPCHGPGLGLPGFGGLPGTQQLAIKYRNTDVPAVLDERTDLVPVFIETVVRQGISFMPQFRKTEISDADLQALTAYLTRNNPAP